MPVPTLSAQQRARALEQAAQARRERSLLRDRLKHGRTTLAETLRTADTDQVIARMRVVTVLESRPGIGPARARRVMAELDIADSRRLRGLGPHQRAALIERFT